MNNRLQRLYDEVVKGNVAYFYTSKTWKKKRQDILKRDNYECQRCKSLGKYSAAEIVHHILHLRVRPDLMLVDSNLMSVCNDCHEFYHPERLEKFQVKKKEFVNEERW